jgi:hypothetical protein
VSEELAAALLDSPTETPTGPTVRLNSAIIQPIAAGVQFSGAVFDARFAQSALLRDDGGPVVVAGAVTTPEVASSFSGGLTIAQRTHIAAVEALTRSLSNAEWMSELDHMREQVDQKIETGGAMAVSSVAVTGSLSVGYVIWLLRGGLLLSSLLSSMPAWHAVDPMPVLARGGDSDDDEGAEADPLEKLFGKARDALFGGSSKNPAPAQAAPAAPAGEPSPTQAQPKGMEVTA